MKGSPVSMLIMVPGSMSVVDLYGGVAHIGGAVNASSVTLDRANGLDMYDFHARLYDPIVPHFITMDELCEKYPSYSPYIYCLGNPINNVDLRGDSVTVLNLGNGQQHLAMLIQNENNKWSYYSVNGNNKYFSGKFTGGRKKNDISVGEFDSPEQFLNSAYNSEGDSNNPNINSYGFSEGFVIPSTPEQDKIMSEAFKEESTKEYNLITTNCATAVINTLNKGGISTKIEIQTPLPPGANVTMGKIIKGNSIVPSAAYEEIKYLNRNGYEIKRYKY